MKNSYDESGEFDLTEKPKEKKKIKSGCAWCGEFNSHFTTVRDDEGKPTRICVTCAEENGY